MPYPLERFWPRSNKAHLALQHIPELRQFGKTEPRKDSRVAAQRRRIAVNIQPVHPERRSILAAAKFFPESQLLSCTKRRGSQRQEGRGERKQQQRANNIHKTLDSHADRRRLAFLERKQRNAVYLLQLRLREVKLIVLGHNMHPYSDLAAIADQFLRFRP